MGRSFSRHIETRKILERFIHTDAGQAPASQGVPEKYQHGDIRRDMMGVHGRKLFNMKVRRVIRQLRSGMMIDGRNVILSDTNWAHIYWDITYPHNAVEIIYGITRKDPKFLSKQSLHRQATNRALEKVELAFYFTGVLRSRIY